MMMFTWVEWVLSPAAMVTIVSPSMYGITSSTKDSSTPSTAV